MSTHWPVTRPDLSLGVFGSPAPALAEMGAGFDALIQYRDDIVQGTCRHSLVSLGGFTTIPISMRDVGLSAEDYKYLRDNATITDLLPTPGSDPSTSSPAAYTAAGFEVHLEPPSIVLEAGTPGGVTVSWSVTVLTVYQQSAASAKSHPGTPALMRKDLANGTLEYKGPIVAEATPGFARCVATVTVDAIEAKLAGPPGLFLNIGKAVTDATLNVLASDVPLGKVALTPLVMLGGSSATLDRLGATSFGVVVTVFNGNQAGTMVLCIAASFDAPDIGGTIGGVRPFVHDTSFAYYANIETMRRLVAATFEPGSGSSLEGVAPVPFKDSSTGATVLGSGHVRMDIKDLAPLTMQPYFWPDGKTLPRDPLRLYGMLHLTLLELFAPDGRSIPLKDLAATFRESDTPFNWTVFPFQSPPDVDDVTEAARQLIDRIVTPALLPIQGAVIDRVIAQSSAAAGALAYWGTYIR